MEATRGRVANRSPCIRCHQPRSPSGPAHDVPARSSVRTPAATEAHRAPSVLPDPRRPSGRERVRARVPSRPAAFRGDRTRPRHERPYTGRRTNHPRMASARRVRSSKPDRGAGRLAATAHRKTSHLAGKWMRASYARPRRVPRYPHRRHCTFSTVPLGPNPIWTSMTSRSCTPRAHRTQPSHLRARSMSSTRFTSGIRPR